MKITEIYEPILEVLSTKRFVNHFEVAIYRPGMNDIIKIKGYIIDIGTVRLFLAVFLRIVILSNSLSYIRLKWYFWTQGDV